MNIGYDSFTGKPIDRLSDLLPRRTDQICDDCGTYLIDRCGRCGAPVCCPRCCAEDAEADQ
jgi:hypothetical protein